MNRFLAFVTLSLVLCFFAISTADAQSPKRLQNGRYQLTVNYDGTMFLLDTATGQCWTKSRRGEWVDAGNPANPKLKPKQKLKVEAAKTPIKLELPRERVQLTITQRHSKVIPGSNGRVRIHVADITHGQSLISVRDDAGAILLDDVSARPGSILEFSVNKRRYYLRVAQLRNFIVGDDFAVVEVSSNRDVFGKGVTPVPSKDLPETPKPGQADAPPKPGSK